MWAESTEMQATMARPIPKWEDADPVAIDYSERHACDVKRPDPSLVNSFPRALYNKYLSRRRGIGFFTALKLNLRYDDRQSRILFPVYDPQDRFCGFTGRSVRDLDEWTKEYPKVRDYYGLAKREVLLGLPSKHRSGKKIVHEGLFDMAMAVKHGYTNARAVLGTAQTPEKIDILLQEGDPIYLFFDNDLAGWQAMFGTFDPDENLKTENAWAYLLYKQIPVWIVPYKTNLTGEDPGSMRDKSVYEAHLKKAWLFTGKAPVKGPGQPSMLRPKSPNT